MGPKGLGPGILETASKTLIVSCGFRLRNFRRWCYGHRHQPCTDDSNDTDTDGDSSNADDNNDEYDDDDNDRRYDRLCYEHYHSLEMIGTMALVVAAITSCIS